MHIINKHLKSTIFYELYKSPYCICIYSTYGHVALSFSFLVKSPKIVYKHKELKLKFTAHRAEEVRAKTTKSHPKIIYFGRFFFYLEAWRFDSGTNRVQLDLSSSHLHYNHHTITSTLTA